MVGYSEESKAYRLYDVEKKEVVVKRDVKFIESEFLRKKSYSEDDNVLVEITPLPSMRSDAINDETVPPNSQEDMDYSIDQNLTVESNSEDDEDFDRISDLRNRRGRPKIIKTGRRGRPRKEYNHSIQIQDEEILIPRTVAEAVNCSNKERWKQAMREEYESLIENETWSVVEKADGQKPIGCKWIFSVKRGKNNTIEKFKARLVAKGCSQKYGINYEETFSPVIRYANIRLLIAIAVEKELYMHQMDVKTAYLNGDLHNDIYMKIPEFFDNENPPNSILKLKKSLYGLKQSGREWNFKLNNVLNQMGFVACPSEPCLYTRHQGEKLNFIAVYVDDLIVACSDEKDLEKNLKTNIESDENG